MDNGQANYNAGKGIYSDAENNLNSENFFGTAEQAPTEETTPYDPSRMGNVAINGELVERPEQIELAPEEVEFEAPEAPKSPFEITEVQPAPGEVSTGAENIIELKALKVDKNDHLPSTVIKALNRYVHQYQSDKISPAEANKSIRDAGEAYLTNSYDDYRAEKGKAA